MILTLPENLTQVKKGSFLLYKGTHFSCAFKVDEIWQDKICHFKDGKEHIVVYFSKELPITVEVI